MPIFPGYYSTLFEPQEADPNETDKSEFYRSLPDPMFNYSDYFDSMNVALCHGVQHLMGDYIHSIEFESICSPKEYNFTNDSINCTIVPDHDKVKHYIEAHSEQWEAYLSSRFKSCSGFISFYSYRPADWVEYTNNFTDYSGKGIYLGAVLDFIASNEGIDSEALYYACDHVSNTIFPEYDFSEYEAAEDKVRDWARENYIAISPDIVCPDELTDENKLIDVPAVIRSEVESIEALNLKLEL